jgi:hypothetical protein
VEVGLDKRFAIIIVNRDHRCFTNGQDIDRHGAPRGQVVLDTCGADSCGGQASQWKMPVADLYESMLSETHIPKQCARPAPPEHRCCCRDPAVWSENCTGLARTARFGPTF